MDQLTEYVEGQGSGYLARVERLDPDADPDLERVGFRSETTLYVVVADGGQTWADTDRYALVREMTGQNDWLLDELDRLRRELVL